MAADVPPNVSTPFDLFITGDLATPEGVPVGDLGLDRLEAAPWMRWRFLAAQVPRPGDSTYQDRLYEMELTADEIAVADGIVVCRPWLKAAALAGGGFSPLLSGTAADAAWSR